MAFGQQQRMALLSERAGGYVRVALANITREYPHMPYFIATCPDDYRTHRDSHPAFYGSFDWHSCVEMCWATVRLLRLFRDCDHAAEARTVLTELLTEQKLTTEVRFFDNPNHRSLERPYGWGWLLTLHHELATWDDPDAQRWASAVAPLAALLATHLEEWLPKLTYPQRVGVHQNTAFGLSRCYDHAAWRAANGERSLLTAIHESATRWFLDDVDYPAHYEPSGADFLSAALCEAELMSRILKPSEFPHWLERFLPGLPEGYPESLFQPVVVSDSTDGQIAHLHGLNLSRAWAFTALAARLPANDSRILPLLESAEHHASASLPHVVGSDYMVEHWLACYATLLLSHDSPARREG
jgi:hypothetical protein